jgi:hypothetical protein
MPIVLWGKEKEGALLSGSIDVESSPGYRNIQIPRAGSQSRDISSRRNWFLAIPKSRRTPADSSNMVYGASHMGRRWDARLALYASPSLTSERSYTYIYTHRQKPQRPCLYTRTHLVYFPKIQTTDLRFASFFSPMRSLMACTQMYSSNTTFDSVDYHY